MILSSRKYNITLYGMIRTLLFVLRKNGVRSTWKYRKER